MLQNYSPPPRPPASQITGISQKVSFEESHYRSSRTTHDLQKEQELALEKSVHLNMNFYLAISKVPQCSINLLWLFIDSSLETVPLSLMVFCREIVIPTTADG